MFYKNTSPVLEGIYCRKFRKLKIDEWVQLSVKHLCYMFFKMTSCMHMPSLLVSEYALHSFVVMRVPSMWEQQSPWVATAAGHLQWFLQINELLHLVHYNNGGKRDAVNAVASSEVFMTNLTTFRITFQWSCYSATIICGTTVLCSNT
jgi:hypothetical protein